MWAQIKPARYKQAGNLKAELPKLQALHDKRVETDPDFQRLIEDVAELKAQRDKGVISLNEADRRKELTARENRLKSRAQLDDGVDTTNDDGLQSNERSLTADIALENARKKAKDILLNEATAILSDAAGLQAGAR